MSNQLNLGISLWNVKIAQHLETIKSLHAKSFVELYTHVQKEQEKIINGFTFAGITEAIQSAGLVLKGIENTFHKQQQKLL